MLDASSIYWMNTVVKSKKWKKKSIDAQFLSFILVKAGNVDLRTVNKVKMTLYETEGDLQLELKYMWHYFSQAW